MMNLIRSGEKNVFASSLDRIEYFNANNALQIELLKERLYLLPIVLFVRKQSCLVDVFEEELQRFASNGLLTHWIQTFQPNHRKRLEENHDDTKWSGRFDLMQLLCAFEILAALHVTATFVLMLEMVSTRVALIKYLVDFLTY